MLEDKLHSFWKSGKFATSWIISSDNLDVSLTEIKNFARSVMNAGNLPIDNNPDFFKVQREDTKSITIDLIRNLQDFLSTTPAVSEYKFGIIMEANLMHNNASNCCLKILEEPPKNTFLFLLTDEPANLMATIKSRCHKLYLRQDNLISAGISYEKFIKEISAFNTDKKINYLKTISTKTKESQWEEFCKNSVHLILNLHKHNLDQNIPLSEGEYSYLNSRRSIRNNLGERPERVQRLVKDEQEFDLDKKHVGILILECLD